MPTYLNLTLALISQYDAMSLPEFQPPASSPNDPFNSHPALISESQPIVSVYIPTYPCSTFWLSYTIAPPHPPKILYYFKLFINGTHIVSWGCGEKENYTGKTMFGLFRGPLGVLERGMLSFSSEDDAGRSMSSEMMEVRVYRSKGRRKIEPKVEEFKAGVDGSGKARQLNGAGISLLNAGFLHPRRHPKRYYQYALLDELDNPYATFRYYYRAWEELERLGVTSSPPSTSPAASPVPSPSLVASDPIRHSIILSNRLSSISLLSLSTPSPSTPHKDGLNSAKTPFNSPENAPATPTHKPAAINRVKEEASIPDDSPLRIPPTFALPPPITPTIRLLSPTKLSPTKASSGGRFRRTPTPVPNLERLRENNTSTTNLAGPVFCFSSEENPSPSPRRSMDSNSANNPRSRPRLSLDTASTTKPRPSLDSLSASATRRAEFGSLVANLMRQSPSPKKGRRAKGSTVNAARAGSEDLKQDDGSSTATGSSENIKLEEGTGEEGDGESEAIETAREALEGKGSSKARRKAHLGFLMGRTEKRRERSVGAKENAGLAEKEAEKEKNERGRSQEKENGGKENERKRSKGRGRSKENERGRSMNKELRREERKTEGMSMRAHFRALANGVPIQVAATGGEQGGGDGEGRRGEEREREEGNWVVWDRSQLEGGGDWGGNGDSEYGEGAVIGLGIAL
ncbi:hypothetical protein MMC30_001298 [Trapelia coarctata]|nr:hypothetical protein [Trapelia coarctata]